MKALPGLAVDGATFSPDGRYRYRLWRGLDGRQGTVVFVMLNPSTADATRDDPTLRRCRHFAAREGYGTLEVANLFARVETKPRRLMQMPPAEAIGPENDAYLLAAGRRAAAVILAYGSLPERWWDRASYAIALLRTHYRGVLWTLGTCANGCPRHPLYVPGDQPLEPF